MEHHNRNQQFLSSNILTSTTSLPSHASQGSQLVQVQYPPLNDIPLGVGCPSNPSMPLYQEHGLNITNGNNNSRPLHSCVPQVNESCNSIHRMDFNTHFWNRGVLQSNIDIGGSSSHRQGILASEGPRQNYVQDPHTTTTTAALNHHLQVGGQNGPSYLHPNGVSSWTQQILGSSDVVKANQLHRPEDLTSTLDKHVIPPPPQATKQYLCTFCGKKCGNRSCLNKHTKTHSGQRTGLQCDQCDFQARDKTEYDHHLTTQHSLREGDKLKKGSNLTELDRGRIIALKEVGWTFQTIAAHIGCSPSSCKTVWRRFTHNGKRKSTTNAAGDGVDVNEEEEEVSDPCGKINSKRIKKKLKSIGLFSRLVSDKNHLTISQKRLRYEFANTYRDKNKYTLDFWRRVIFYDERNFNIARNNKVKIHHTLCPGTDSAKKKEQKCIGKFGLGLNICGYFDGSGNSELCLLPAKFDSEAYVELLKNHIIPSLRNTYPEPQNIYLFQEKSPTHCSSLLKNFIKTVNNIKLITLPPKGSDLNPWETLWNLLGEKIIFRQDSTLEDFQSSIFKMWEEVKVDNNPFRALSEGMVGKIESIYNSHGEKKT